MHDAVNVAVVVLVIAAVPGMAGVASAETPDAAAHAVDAQNHCEFPYTATDATGTAVTVESPPERVVTLAPSAAQTVWEIGAREKVVGVSQYATYLEGAGSRANVSAAGDAFVNVEAVVAADPDLVLAPNVIVNDTVEKLRDAGLTVYRFHEADSLEAIKEKTLLTGSLVGECGGAETTVDRMDRRLETVRETVEGQDRPRVLYVFFGFTAGNGTFIHRMITTAGGDNVATRANITGFQRINPEVVVEQNPEWIVVNDGSPTVPNTEAYNGTDAVKNNRTLVLREEHVSQPAPRVVRAIVKMAKAFHPEAYEAANRTATATPTDTETATQTTTETSTATETEAATATTAGDATGTDSPGAPGFGAGVVLAAALVVALLARRR